MRNKLVGWLSDSSLRWPLFGNHSSPFRQPCQKNRRAGYSTRHVLSDQRGEFSERSDVHRGGLNAKFKFIAIRSFIFLVGARSGRLPSHRLPAEALSMAAEPNYPAAIGETGNRLFIKFRSRKSTPIGAASFRRLRFDDCAPEASGIFAPE